VKSVGDMAKLWLHEACRVYKDKLVDEKDMSNYDEISMDIAKKFFEVCFLLASMDILNTLITAGVLPVNCHYFIHAWVIFIKVLFLFFHSCSSHLIFRCGTKWKTSVFGTRFSSFQDVPDNVLKPDPLIFCHFATGIGEPKYFPINTWDGLNKLLVEALDNYNEMNAVMNLVLFGDAMAHV